MVSRHTLRYIVGICMAGGIIGSLSQITLQALNLDTNFTYLFCLIGCFIGAIVTKKSDAIKTVLVLKQLERNKSKQLASLYNLLALCIFLSPLVLFIAKIPYGTIDFISLCLSLICLYYLLKFVDYQTIITPVTVEANIFSILFIIIASLQLIVYPVYVLFTQNFNNNIAVFLTASIIFFQGIWMASMLNGARPELKNLHPRLYHDDAPYRSLFNILSGTFLMGGLVFNMALEINSLISLALALFSLLLLALLMAPLVGDFINQRKKMADIQTKSKYKKLRAQIRNDAWEDDVLSQSNTARFLNLILWTVIVISLFVGLTIIYYTIYAWNFLYLMMGLSIMLSALITTHYRISTRGERVQDFFRFFRAKKLTDFEIRRFADIAMVILSIILGLLFSVVGSLKTVNIEQIIWGYSGFEITNLSILIILAAMILITIVYFVLHLRGRLKKEDYANNKRILQSLMILVCVTTVIFLSILFYQFMNVLTASIVSSIIVILFVFLFFKALRNM